MRPSRQRLCAALVTCATTITTTLTLTVAGTVTAPAAQAAAVVPATPLVSTAATTWTYLEDDSDPARGDTADPKVWTRAGYDTTGWKTAKGSFGAKNGVVADLGGGHTPNTLLRQYTTGTTNVRTYFLRSTFTLEAGVAAQIDSLAGAIAYDDAAKIYLNGVKVAGFADGDIPDATNNAYGGSNLSAPVEATFSIPGSALVDGVNTIAVQLHNRNSSSSDVYVDLKSLTAVARTSSLPTAPLVSTAGTTWTYLDDDSDPARGDTEDPKVWTTPGFDTTGWKSATGSFGAKNGTGLTVGPYTASTLLRHYVDGTAAPTVRTYFFRTTFDLTQQNIDATGSLLGDIVYDDAVTVYLNGERVAGFLDESVPPETNRTYAGNSFGDPVASTFSIPASLLRAGTNTLAVSLYQDRATSSDIYLDLRSLTAVAPDSGATPPTRVILTPTEDTATEQAVTWLAGNDADSTGELQVQPVAGGDVRTIVATDSGLANGNVKRHLTAVATGLTPDTAYRYRVGVPEAWSPWYEFTTADPTSTDLQFVYYGDAQIGLDTTWPAVVGKAAAKAPDSIGSVHAGDLIDTASNETQWLNWFKGMGESAATTNVFAAPGNHEYSGDNKLAAWKAHFNYPLNQPSLATIGDLADLAVGDTDVARQYRAYFEHWSTFAGETVYTSVYQNTRFITLNATRDTGFLTPSNLPACTGSACPSTKVAALWTEFQARWMDHVLDRNTAKWTVVTFHQPVYSGSTGRNEPVLRQYWVPVFQEHDVDLVAMGHDHVYVRGYNNANRTDVDGITDGPVYAVANSGGKYYDLNTAADNVWVANGATQVKAAQDVTTYQVVDVTENTFTYRSWVGAVNGSGGSLPAVDSLFDTFTITKDDAGTKWVTEAGVDIPVTIQTQPAPSTSATPGDDVTLSVAASAGPDAVLTYQWQQQAPGAEAWTDVAGATTRELVVTDVTRAMDGARYRVVATNGSRSATSEPSTLSVEAPSYATIKINEVVSSGGVPGDWVELKNTGSTPVDLGGLRFRDNTPTNNYVIPAGTTIAAGGYYVLEEAAFGFGLGSADEANLFEADGTTVVDAYAWTTHRTPSYGRCPDGTGPFVQNTAASKGSTNTCGTTSTDYGTIRINEVESNGGTPGDWVELKNTGATPVDISGIRFRDNDATHAQYVVPAGTTIAAGGYVVLEEAAFGFGLGGADSAVVWRPDGTTVIDEYSWTTHAAVTYGRCPDGTGVFVDTYSSTKGAPNDCNPVKINEVESDGGTPGDWVELKNNSSAAVDVSGYVLRDNDDANGYVIPAGTSIAGGGYLVLENPTHVTFGLGASDSARLFAPGGTTLLDSHTWTTHAATTYGRCPDGTGAFATTQQATKGQRNLCPGDLVTSPWPGGADVRTVDPQGTFASNLSGLDYVDGTLWGVRNGPGLLAKFTPSGDQWVLAPGDWAAGKALHYPNGQGDVDAEGVTVVTSGSDAGLYVGSERDNSVSGTSRPSVLRYDPETPGTSLSATHEWNLAPDFPGLGANAGIEGVSYLSDAWLVEKGFVDPATGNVYDPGFYAGHGDGLFLVGVEGTGRVYLYALSRQDGSAKRVASFASGFPGVMELDHEPETDQLWVVCDEACQGRTARFDVVDGVFAPVAYYERPAGMPATIANEGFTVGPRSECVDGRKPVWWADDNATDGFSLRQGTLSCTDPEPDPEPLPQVVTFTSAAPADAAVGDVYTVAATGGASGNPVTFASTTPSVCSTDGATVTLEHAGTCTVRASQAGNDDYQPGSATQDVVVGKAAQAVAFTSSPPASPVVGSSYMVSAAGGPSGTPVVFSSTTATCTVSGSTVTVVAPGACVVTASQAGTDDYLAATGTQSVTAVKASTSVAVTVAPSSVRAVVSVMMPGAAPVAGEVRVLVDDEPVGTAAVVDGVATLEVVVPPGAARTVEAVYSGSALLEGATGTTTRRDPLVTAELTSSVPPNAAGWWGAPVRVTFTCTPQGAAVTQCPAPVVLDRSGAAVGATSSATAADGGVGTATVSVRLDLDAPTVRVAGVRDGATYPLDAPTPRCVAADAHSGVASCALTTTRRGRVTTVVAAATDRVGRTATTRVSWRRPVVRVAGALRVNAAGEYVVRRGETLRVVALLADRPTPRVLVPARRDARFGRTVVMRRGGAAGGLTTWNRVVRVGEPARAQKVAVQVGGRRVVVRLRVVG